MALTANEEFKVREFIRRMFSQYRDELTADQFANCILSGLVDRNFDVVVKEKPEYYLLQKRNAGYLGNSPVFYHKGGSGYTQWIDEAKHWTKEEAEKIIRSTQGTHDWVLWKLDEVKSAARYTVDTQNFVIENNIAVLKERTNGTSCRTEQT